MEFDFQRGFDELLLKYLRLFIYLLLEYLLVRYLYNILSKTLYKFIYCFFSNSKIFPYKFVQYPPLHPLPRLALMDLILTFFYFIFFEGKKYEKKAEYQKRYREREKKKKQGTVYNLYTVYYIYYNILQCNFKYDCKVSRHQTRN